MNRSAFTSFAFVLFVANSALETQAAEAPVVISRQTLETEMPVTIARTISLADLGISDGLEFRQLFGETTLYFPVLANSAIESGSFKLNLTHGATNEVERYLQISLGTRVAHALALDRDGGSLSIEIPVKPSDIRNGFLQVGLSYSGAYSDRACVDERVSGDYLVVESDSSLTLDLNPTGVDTPRLVAGLMPRNVRINFPNTGPSNIAVAMNAASVFGAESGHVSFGSIGQVVENGEHWTTTDITVTSSAFGGASDMSAMIENGFPALQITGTDPQVGFNQLSSIWAGLSNASLVRTSIVGSTRSDGGETLDLTNIGSTLASQPVSSGTNFEFPFRAADIPTGKAIVSVDLIVASTVDPEGNGATVTAFFNNSILGSRPLKSGDPERMLFDVPDGLVGRDNMLRVLVQRKPSGGNCAFNAVSYPAQVLPGSKLQLEDGDGEVRDFFILSQQFREGADLIIDPDLDMIEEDILLWTAGIAGSILPDGAQVSLKGNFDSLDGASAFIFISKSPPPESDPRVRLDAGAIEIKNSTGSTMFDGEALDRIGIVQIVDVNGMKGLWIRPGSGPAPDLSDRQPLVLDRGDLALIDIDGVVVATSTERRDLISVVYPNRTSVSQILAKYRPWIVGGIWIVLTLIILGFFQRLYRSRRPTQSEE